MKASLNRCPPCSNALAISGSFYSTQLDYHSYGRRQLTFLSSVIRCVLPSACRRIRSRSTSEGGRPKELLDPAADKEATGELELSPLGDQRVQ